MPYLILAAFVFAVGGSTSAGDPGDAMRMFTHATPGQVQLAFDDEVYGDRDTDDDDSAEPNDRDHSYFDDDDDDDSAHEHDDDDGGDDDEFEHSERA